MSTFIIELNVPSQEPNEEGTRAVPVSRKRVFTFKELDEYDQDQQKLHFKLNTVFESSFKENNEQVGSERVKITLDSDAVHELIVKFINVCLITTDENGEKDGKKELDKTELLHSSKALYRLGTRLINEKFLPFFLAFRGD